MANSIGLAKEYLDILDAEYKNASKTSVLDVVPALVKASPNAGTFYIRQLALVGLGDYSKTTGPPAGDVTNTWLPHTYDFDRGRKFDVDALDQESRTRDFQRVRPRQDSGERVTTIG